MTGLLSLAGCLHLRGQAPGDPDRQTAARLEPPPPPPPPPERLQAAPQPAPAPIQVRMRLLRGERAYVVRIQLSRIEPRLIFAKGRPGPQRVAENFDKLRQRAASRLVSSGTFFGIHSHATMGTLVSDGHVRQYAPADHRGTLLAIDADHVARLTTLAVDSPPDDAAFALQAGPRLVRNGSVWLHPRLEGFRDPALFAPARRMAIGLTHGGRVLLLVAFPEAVSLKTEALALRDLGARNALNLDGGSSTALALGDHIFVSPTAPLTHVIAFTERR